MKNANNARINRAVHGDAETVVLVARNSTMIPARTKVALKANPTRLVNQDNPTAPVSLTSPIAQIHQPDAQTASGAVNRAVVNVTTENEVVALEVVENYGS